MNANDLKIISLSNMNQVFIVGIAGLGLPGLDRGSALHQLQQPVEAVR